MSTMRARVLSVLCVLVGCTEATPGAEPIREGGAAAPDASVRDAAADAPSPRAHLPSDALRACAQKVGEVRSIAETTARFNALLPTADASCFLATLPRPLSVVATSGLVSAQPAGGKGSPRLFFLSPNLVVSAVPAGEGSKVVELGEWVTPTRTLKGEIGVPVLAPLSPEGAFERIVVGSDRDRTMCATCHRFEERSSVVAGGFVSVAYKPEPGTFVTVAELRALHDACTDTAEASARCEMFHAVFDFGEVREGAFARDVETFFPPP